MEIDVTEWAVIQPEAGGADQDKDWLSETNDAPRVEQWLWKPRQRTGNGSHKELSDVSEVLASEIAHMLALPAARCVYARRGTVLGVLSKNVSPRDCDLHLAQIYLESVPGYVHRSPGGESQQMRRRLADIDVGYTLEAVAEVLRDVPGPPPHWQSLTGMQVFSGYLVLDALIANTDRHPRNWAMLEPWDGTPRMLAPAFDHGRALGSGLTDDNRRTRDPVAFWGRGAARPFTPSDELLVDLAHRAVSRYDGGMWLQRLAALEDDALASLVEASESRMSVVASTFVTAILNENRRRLCDDNARRH